MSAIKKTLRNQLDPSLPQARISKLFSMTTTEPSEVAPTNQISPSGLMNSPAKHSNSVEGKARNILDRLSLLQPSTNTNYISLAIGYGRQAVNPMVTQWTAWSPMHRFLAACMLLPTLAAPTMTLAFLAPIAMIVCVIGYIAVFGLEVSKQHYDEAVKEHFGASALTLDSFKQRADELKQRAEGTGHIIVQRLLHYISLSVSQILIVVVLVLDHIIAVYNIN